VQARRQQGKGGTALANPGGRALFLFLLPSSILVIARASVRGCNPKLPMHAGLEKFSATGRGQGLCDRARLRGSIQQLVTSERQRPVCRSVARPAQKEEPGRYRETSALGRRTTRGGTRIEVRWCAGVMPCLHDDVLPFEFQELFPTAPQDKCKLLRVGEKQGPLQIPGLPPEPVR